MLVVAMPFISTVLNVGASMFVAVALAASDKGVELVLLVALFMEWDGGFETSFTVVLTLAEILAVVNSSLSILFGICTVSNAKLGTSFGF